MTCSSTSADMIVHTPRVPSKRFANIYVVLSEELVPLALFSTYQGTRKGLFLSQARLTLHSHWNGKPKFPESTTAAICLSDLFRSNSWFFLQILQLTSSFFDAGVSEWFALKSYQTSMANVNALNATNAPNATITPRCS